MDRLVYWPVDSHRPWGLAWPRWMACCFVLVLVVNETVPHDDVDPCRDDNGRSAVLADGDIVLHGRRSLAVRAIVLAVDDDDDDHDSSLVPLDADRGDNVVQVDDDHHGSLDHYRSVDADHRRSMTKTMTGEDNDPRSRDGP